MVCACCRCAEYVEEFKAEYGEVRTSLIEALQQNRRLQESPALLAVMLSVVDSGKVAGSNPQISDVVDVWIGKKVKDFSLFTMAMGLACVQGLGRYITCIAQKIGECRLCFMPTLLVLLLPGQQIQCTYVFGSVHCMSKYLSLICGFGLGYRCPYIYHTVLHFTVYTLKQGNM